jgi:hypothetical protein
MGRQLLEPLFGFRAFVVFVFHSAPIDLDPLMNEHNPQQRDHAEQKENLSGEDVEHQPQENAKYPKPTEDYSDEAEEQIRRFGRYLGREWGLIDFSKRVELSIAGIGLLALVVYTIYSTMMYGANRDSADAATSATNTARQTLLQGTRPWVGIEGGGELKISGLQIVSSPSSDPDHPVQISVSADYVLRNSGNSIARREFAAFVVYPFPKSTDFPDNWRKNGCEVAEKISVDKFRSAAAIFPGATVSNSNNMVINMTAAEIFIQEFWISGCIVYQDPYGTLHHTKILYRSVTDTTADPIVAIQSPKVSYPPIKSWQIWDTDAD